MRRRLGQGDWWVWEDAVLRSAGFPLGELTAAASHPVARLAEAYARDLADPAVEDEYRAAWSAAQYETNTRMLDLACSDPVLKAMTWQNPALIERVINWLRKHLPADGEPLKRSRPWRRQEATLVGYLQRYHAKNDTVGFFGPSAWVRVGGIEEHARFHGGPDVVAESVVHFEDWPVEALAASLADDPRIRHHLPPVLTYDVTLLGRALVRSDGSVTTLDADLADLAALSDGRRTPRLLAAELTWRTGAPVGEDVVLANLGRLAAMGLLHWGFDVPQGPHALQSLHDQIDRLPPCEARATAAARVEEFERARLDLASAAHTAETLRAGIRRLDEAFEEATGVAAERRPGMHTAGRRLLLPESRRDVDLTIGDALLSQLAAPLTLVLDSARWLVSELGRRYELVLHDTVRELAVVFGTDAVPLGLVMLHGRQAVAEATPSVSSLLQDKWRRLLNLDPAVARACYRAADLAPEAGRLFLADRAAWFAGAHHSPDLMIAADGLDALRAGRYEVVLGELHIAMATVDSNTFLHWHPKPGRIGEAAREHDHPHERFVPLYARGLPHITGRHYPDPEHFSPAYRYLSFGPRCGARPAPSGRVLEIRDLEVPVPTDGRALDVRHREGSRVAPLLDVLGELLSQAAVDAFSPMPPMPHTPRVTIDKLVLARETWRVPSAELPHLTVDDEAVGYARLRAWAAAEGMPRHLFWRTPEEPKPVYLDLDSPALAALFTATTRRSQRADPDSVTVITEMRPDPSELWLTASGNRRYTSEIRLVAADGRGQ
ncbi:lantibiotic dehydratase [Nonomuraea sp. NPDC048916]|uniref:lantibiotic dehydratase n=1 Tax=Nonomuraea sp. NPDC048916 TaxID=3154232 RepID=UPI0033F60F0D